MLPRAIVDGGDAKRSCYGEKDLHVSAGHRHSSFSM
jgi:hypothetical protein